MQDEDDRVDERAGQGDDPGDEPQPPVENVETMDESELDLTEVESVVSPVAGAEAEEEESESKRLSKFPLLTIVLTAGLVFILVSTVYNFVRAKKEQGIEDINHVMIEETQPDGTTRQVEKQVVYINMWDVPRPGSPSVTQRTRRVVMERFLEKYPWIRIRKTRGIQVEGQARESSFLMAMAGGTAPDIFFHNFRSVRSYIEQGFVMDLTEFIERDWSEQKQNELLLRRIRPIISEEEKKSDGRIVYHYYAVPRSFDDLMGLYYRKDLFLKAGLPIDGPEAAANAWGIPWDWDALYRCAQKLTVPEEGQYGYYVQSGFIAGWMWPNFVWQAGGEIVREWVRCPQCDEITPVPKDTDGIPLSDPEAWRCPWVKCPKCNTWNPPPEWADKPWWALPEVAGDPKDPTRFKRDPWKCSKCDGDLHGAKPCNEDLLRKGKRFWRTAYDEPPAVRALELYRKLRWAYWTRCRSPQCQGKNVTYDITYAMCGDNDPERANKVVIGPLPGNALETGEAVCPVCGQRIKLSVLSERRQLYQGVAFASSTDDAGRMFTRDRTLAMSIGTTSTSFVGNTGYNPDEFGVAGLPSGPTGIRANFLNATLISVNSAVKDPEKKRACWEYINFVTSEEADELKVRTSVENGLARFLPPKKLEKYGYNEYLQFVPESWKKVFDELLANGQPEPYCPGYKSVATQGLAEPLDTVIFGADKSPAEELRSSGERVNKDIFGVVAPKVMKRRRVAAYLIAVLLTGFFIIMLTLFVRNLRLLIKAQSKGIAASYLKTSMVTAWLFMIPAIATIFIWQYVPLVRGSVMAFMDYYILMPSKFIGLDNFINVIVDKIFWRSVRNTFIYTLLIIVIGFGVPIFLALLLAEIPKFKVLFRVIFYLPAVTSGLVIMFLWKKFYDPSPAGTFNTILGFLHRSEILHKILSVLHIDEAMPWLQDTRFPIALLCIIIPGVWAGAGPGSIIYLAAMKAVPDELYEAADIDGASTFQKIWHITFPFLKPLILINFVGAFVGAFRANQNIFVMTGGGPANQTLTLGLNIYLKGFLFLKFGQATAIAWLMGALLIGFTIYQLRILRDVRFTAAANQ
ncbi:MAG: extracellular solute-binding protein [Planctomycetes bacterium]|nr:extracellular solute-binding protein [Planctomycetota bacterium]